MPPMHPLLVILILPMYELGSYRCRVTPEYIEVDMRACLVSAFCVSLCHKTDFRTAHFSLVLIHLSGVLAVVVTKPHKEHRGRIFLNQTL